MNYIDVTSTFAVVYMVYMYFEIEENRTRFIVKTANKQGTGENK